MKHKKELNHINFRLWITTICLIIVLIFTIIFSINNMYSDDSQLMMTIQMILPSTIIVIIVGLSLRLILIGLKSEMKIRRKYLFFSYLNLFHLPLTIFLMLVITMTIGGGNFGNFFNSITKSENILALIILIILLLVYIFMIISLILAYIKTKEIKDSYIEQLTKEKEAKLEIKKNQKIELLEQKKQLKKQQEIDYQKKLEAKEEQRALKLKQKEQNLVIKNEQKELIVKEKKEAKEVKKSLRVKESISIDDTILSKNSNIYSLLAFFSIFIATISISFYAYMNLSFFVKYTYAINIVIFILMIASYLFCLIKMLAFKNKLTLSEKKGYKLYIILTCLPLILLFLTFINSLLFYINPKYIFLIPQVNINITGILIMISSILLILIYIYFLKLSNDNYIKLYNDFYENKDNMDQDYLLKHKKQYDKLIKKYILVNGYFYTNKNNEVKVAYKNANKCTIAVLVFAVLYLIYSIVSYVGYKKTLTFEIIGLPTIYLTIMPLFTSLAFLAIVIAIYLRRRIYTKLFLKEVYLNKEANSIETDYVLTYIDYINNDQKLKKYATKIEKRCSKGLVFSLYCDIITAIFIGIPFTICFIYVVVMLIIISFFVSMFSSSSSSTTTSSSSSYNFSPDNSQNTQNPNRKLYLEGNGYNEWYEVDDSGDIKIYNQYTNYKMIGRDIYYNDGQWTKIATLSIDSERGTVLYLDNYNGPKLFDRWEIK